MSIFKWLLRVKDSLKVLTPIDKECIHKNGRVAFPEISRYSFNDSTKVDKSMEHNLHRTAALKWSKSGPISRRP